ncbi:Phosphatidylglycerol/phosphatidylinositol transfer protein [Apiospora aurea]|uniref:Phosphatidylglycerol/phosphatidylinositol transfer protein n=1 Tax=Apiospora aurea TaxID=335848 RepID=A0ABR1Q2L1_9PEZI
MIAPSHLLLALASCIVVTRAVPLDGAPAHQQRPMAPSPENSGGGLKVFLGSFPPTTVPIRRKTYSGLIGWTLLPLNRPCMPSPFPPLPHDVSADIATQTPRPLYHSGHYQKVQLYGDFAAAATSGDVPWLNITATVNGRGLGTMFYMPQCDLNLFQKVSLPLPPGGGGDGYQETPVEMHRVCPSGIRKGYAEISSPPVLLYPEFVPIGKWEVRAEATTREGRRIFCVEGVRVSI